MIETNRTGKAFHDRTHLTLHCRAADRGSRRRAIHADAGAHVTAVDPGVLRRQVDYPGRLKVDYPTPYELATEEAIRKTLEHVHAYVDQAAPVHVIDGDTGAPVTDLTRLPAKVALARTDMQILTYEWGVTYAGMLRAAQVTGDPRYRHYTDERLSAIATLAAHAKKQLPPGTTRTNYPPSAHGLAAVHPVAARAR